MCLGGLKKCVPMKRDLDSLDSFSEILSIESPEVFVVRMALGFK